VKNIFALFLCLLSCQSYGQIISTCAGNGIGGFSGDSGLAINAMINSPADIAADDKGNMFVSDWFNQRIRKVDSNGIISTIAGIGIPGFSGDGSLARFASIYNPKAITSDSFGNIYFVDESNFRIRKINASGIISTIAGNGISGYSGDGGLAIQASLDFIYPDLISDKQGNLYFTQGVNHVVRKISTTGIISTIAGTGSPGSNGNGGLAMNARLNIPCGIAFDQQGNLHIADLGNNQIRKVDTLGIISRIAGSVFGTPGYSGDSSLALSSLLARPEAIIIDNLNNIYFSDGGNERIRKIDPFGMITTYAGNGTRGYSNDGYFANYAAIGYISGLGIDKKRNLYLADNENSRIRKVTPGTVINNLKNDLIDYEKIIFYPNPSNGLIELQTNKTGYQKIHVFDLNNNEVYREAIFNEQRGQKTKLDLQKLENGVYTLLVKNDEAFEYRRLVIAK
jgi:trimeric autotransporter adhesin